MSQPFKLTSWEKPNMAARTKKRLAMPMKNFGREVDWLYEAPLGSPELSLGVAVLQRAVLDLITPGVSDIDRKDALNWVNGNYGCEFESSYSLSFTRIVESFSNIEVEEFRERIMDFVKNANRESTDTFRFQRT